jgi:uncharacterized protein HemX
MGSASSIAPPTCTEHVSCPLAAVAVDLIGGLKEIEQVAESQKSLTTVVEAFKRDLIHISLAIVLAFLPVGAGFMYFLISSTSSIQKSLAFADAQRSHADALAGEANQKADKALDQFSKLEAALGKTYGLGQRNHASLDAMKSMTEQIEQNTTPAPKKPGWFRR